MKKTLATLDSTSAAPTAPAAVDDAHEALGQAGALEHPLDSLADQAASASAGLSTTPLPAMSAMATSPSGIDQG